MNEFFFAFHYRFSISVLVNVYCFFCTSGVNCCCFFFILLIVGISASSVVIWSHHRWAWFKCDLLISWTCVQYISLWLLKWMIRYILKAICNKRKRTYKFKYKEKLIIYVSKTTTESHRKHFIENRN